jgi:hypothetical protein
MKAISTRLCPRWLGELGCPNNVDLNLRLILANTCASYGLEGWKIGRMEDWKIGRLDDW